MKCIVTNFHSGPSSPPRSAFFFGDDGTGFSSISRWFSPRHLYDSKGESRRRRSPGDLSGCREHYSENCVALVRMALSHYSLWDASSHDDFPTRIEQ